MNATKARNADRNIIAFEFSIGQRVLINAIDEKGLVQGLMVTCDGLEYLVAYFNDDKNRCKEWLTAGELSRL